MQSSIFLLMSQELAVSVLVLALLIMKLGGRFPTVSYLGISLVVVLACTVVPVFSAPEGSLFAGMFLSSPLLALEKSILTAAVFILLMVHYDTIKVHKHAPELLVLVFSSLLGMLLMVSSGNWLMLYISLELAAIPAAALVSFDLGSRRSSEGAMKMILTSAFASGIFLFGISLLYGSTGTLQFSEMGLVWKGDALQTIGFILVLSGFAFKLSAVPFHLWTADVYEGAPIPVTAYLSVVSKAAAAFVFMTVLYRIFLSSIGWIRIVLIVLALLTLLVGNLFAIRQTVLKRFMAFSSITQAGFILVAISSGAVPGMAAVVYFLLIYLFSNLAFFGVISVFTTYTGRDSIDGLRGLYQHNTFLSWVMVIALFSLAGIPPTAGFFGKLFLIFAGAIKGSVGFILIVTLNIVISLYYYLRIVRAVFSDGQGQAIAPIPISLPTRIGMIICVLSILVAGMWGGVYEFIKSLV